MERGTEWERDAIIREWVALERERQLATRSVLGLAFLLGGIPLLIRDLVYPFEVCYLPLYNGAEECIPASMWWGTRGLLVGLGVTLPAVGGTLCVSALHRNGRRTRRLDE